MRNLPAPAREAEAYKPMVVRAIRTAHAVLTSALGHLTARTLYPTVKEKQNA